MNRKRTWVHKLAIDPLEDRCLFAAGFLDPTFAADGLVTTNVGLLEWVEQPWDVAVYPGSTPGSDGRIVAVGDTVTRVRSGGVPGPDHDFALVRYNPDGSLDASFGNGGKVTTSMSSYTDYALSVELVGNKILVGGFANESGFALARYNDNGSLDTAFGAKGKVITKVTGGGLGLAMKVDASGKIVMAGVSGTGALAVIRYNASGAQDKTFDKDGIATASLGQNIAVSPGAMELAITPASAGATNAGKIVVVGRLTGSGLPDSLFVARYTTAGTLDPTFDGDGLVTLASDAFRTSVAVQSDGRIVVVYDQEVIRLNTDGALDTSFDGDGRVTNSRPGVATAVTLQPDGKILVAGMEVLDPVTLRRGFFAARYTTAGTLDPTFGTGGVGLASEADPGAATPRVAMALQGNGKVVIAGKSEIQWPTGGIVSDFVMARFQGDDALHATAHAPNPASPTAILSDVRPLADEVISRWQDAGIDFARLQTINIRIADLAGTTLGLASGSTICHDAGYPRSGSAAGWCWFVDATPSDDSEFATLGNQGEQHRIDLLTALVHEIGHLLGREHNEDDVMAGTLAAGGLRGVARDELAASVDAIFASTADRRGDGGLASWIFENLDSTRPSARRAH